MNTDQVTDQVEPTTPPPNAALKLGPKYDTALLGATIKGEFVYSLSKLTDIETTEEVTREQAQAYIAEQVIDVTRQWGDTAPVFVDDSLFVEPVNIEIMAPDERPRILLPR